MSVAIIDYGSGNLHSAAKAFERAARDSGSVAKIAVTSDPDQVRKAERIVLPGGGNAVLATVAARAPGVPVLGYTTHVLARQTQPLHDRCDRVVTKETLTQELPQILREGVPA